MRDRTGLMLPQDVAAVTGLLMQRLDERLPGQLDALYLVGSVAQEDYQPGRSDIDFVAVLDGPQDVGILAGLHAELAHRFAVSCDGIYLRPGALEAPPAATGLRAREGRIVTGSADERHPVTWLTLAEQGIALRGRDPGPDWIAADPAAAIRYSRDNLISYWSPWLDRHRSLLTPGGLALLSGDAVVWGCLGLLRLHGLIAAGKLLSKSGAGAYGAAAFPEHAEITGEALRLRRGEAPALGLGLSRRRAALGLMQAVLEDGLRPRPERGGPVGR